MMGTMFCQYETPCGYCVRLDKECPEKGIYKPRKKASAVSSEADEKLLNPAGEYAVKFAENHRISIDEAMQEPMVKPGLRHIQPMEFKKERIEKNGTKNFSNG